MPEVDIRWRPSGGRGEYEHVPQQILLGRKLVVSAVSVPGAYINTDVTGQIRDGKPRLRRDNPNDHSILNVHQLIPALALLPSPRRDDPGALTLPIRAKNYVVSEIRFAVEHADDNRAICTPLRMKILHDSGTIDLVERLTHVGQLLNSPGLNGAAQALATQYRNLVQSGVPSADLVAIGDKLASEINGIPELAEALDSPSDAYVKVAPPVAIVPLTLKQLTAKEAARKLVSHYKIERSQKIRKAKITLALHEHDGALLCENCEFSFEVRYGERGKGYMEVHHKQPLAALLPNVVTSLSDLMLLCSNCHRMVHRKQPPLTPEGLKETTHV